MLFFLLAIATISLLTTHSLAENVTSVNQLVFALSGSRISHAYEDVFGSVIAADKNAITVHLDSGPSTLVYTSSSGTLYAYHACSKTVEGGEFVCTYHNNVFESRTIDEIVSQRGRGGYATMQITAGIEKLTNAPMPTLIESGTAKSWDGSGRGTWTMLWGSLGITFFMTTVFGWKTA
ncbi:TFIIH basal transcription factor complex p47 subunit [Venturia nashicola]|nr:TFIIH basal transcription factor complex p47 subunit [Venturia nashicola]